MVKLIGILATTYFFLLALLPIVLASFAWKYKDDAVKDSKKRMEKI